MKELDTEFPESVFREESENDTRRIEKPMNKGLNVGPLETKFFLGFDTPSVFYVFLHESFAKSKKQGYIRDQRQKLNRIMIVS
jgi:hypothetical protein